MGNKMKSDKPRVKPERPPVRIRVGGFLMLMIPSLSWRIAWRYMDQLSQALFPHSTRCCTIFYF